MNKLVETLNAQIWQYAMENGVTEEEMFSLGCRILAFNYSLNRLRESSQQECHDFFIEWYNKLVNDTLSHLRPTAISGKL